MLFRSISLSVVLLSRLILNLREENIRRSSPTASIMGPNDHHGFGMYDWDGNINNLFSNISTVDQMVFQNRTSGLTMFSIDGMLPIRDSEIFDTEFTVGESGLPSEDCHLDDVCLDTCDKSDESFDEDCGAGTSVGNSDIGSRRERSDSQRALIATV